MLPDQVSNPGPLTYESGALPIALRGPARICKKAIRAIPSPLKRSDNHQQQYSGRVRIITWTNQAIPKMASKGIPVQKDGIKKRF